MTSRDKEHVIRDCKNCKKKNYFWLIFIVCDKSCGIRPRKACLSTASIYGVIFNFEFYLFAFEYFFDWLVLVC
jgi:hypothetical protein